MPFCGTYVGKYQQCKQPDGHEGECDAEEAPVPLCFKAPAGWMCTRPRDHGGPCAAKEARLDPEPLRSILGARPDESVLDAARRVVAENESRSRTVKDQLTRLCSASALNTRVATEREDLRVLANAAIQFRFEGRGGVFFTGRGPNGCPWWIRPGAPGSAITHAPKAEAIATARKLAEGT